MPRGAKRDLAVTKLLYANGLLLDRRSFVSLPRKDDGTVHLFFEGADVAGQRSRLWQKKTRPGERAPRCELRLYGCDYYAAEMDHKQGGLDGRCDCRHNLQPVCVNCHRLKHPHTRFGEGNQEEPAWRQKHRLLRTATKRSTS
jgi:hypothetical protein